MRHAVMSVLFLAACATPAAPQDQSSAPLTEPERAEMQALIHQLDAQAAETLQHTLELDVIANAWRVCRVGELDRAPIRERLVRDRDAPTRARFARLFALQARDEPEQEYAPGSSPCEGGNLEQALVWLGANPPSPWDNEHFERPSADEASVLTEEEEEELHALQLGLYGTDYAFGAATLSLASAIRHFAWCDTPFERARAEAHLFAQAALPDAERRPPRTGIDAQMSADTIERARRLMELTERAARRDRRMWRTLGIEMRLQTQVCGLGQLAVTRRGVAWVYELEGEGP